MCIGSLEKQQGQCTEPVVATQCIMHWAHAYIYRYIRSHVDKRNLPFVTRTYTRMHTHIHTTHPHIDKAFGEGRSDMERHGIMY